MQLVMYYPSANAVWADALFVSVLQGSDKPCAGQCPKAAWTTRGRPPDAATGKDMKRTRIGRTAGDRSPI